MRRRLLLAVVALAVVLGGASLGYVLVVREQGRDVRGSSTVEFVPTALPAPPPPPPPPPAPRPRKGRKPPPPPPPPPFTWPTYGYVAERVRYAPSIRLRPPFRRIWRFRARNLIEFPPVIRGSRLYFSNNSGVLFAIDSRTGKRAWRYRSNRCVAASPAVEGGTVYQTFLNRPPCNTKRRNLEGELVAFAAGFGKVRWRRRLGPSESSPLVAGGRLYVGDWRGNVYALDAETGREHWRFRTGGKIKSGVALSGNRLFVGSYDHHVYALDVRTGEQVWRAGAQPRLRKRGTFYSTPAVAYGRVYIGSTDGKVYSFGAASGKLRWSHGTGGYVYGSPAVWRQRILVGSYDGRFYALDAATGDVRWSFRANGPISGSATVLAGVVYFSTLERRTYALDARTGKELWSFPDGKYTPVVADPKRLYLVGYARVYGMVER